MPKVYAFALFLLSGLLAIVVASGAQDYGAPAVQQPAQGNPPQQGVGRGPAGPVDGPPHDPHDLTGVWNTRRGYGGNSYDRQGPDMTAWGQQQYKLAKSSNSGQYTLQETNDPVIAKCFPPGVPRIYLQPFPLQIVQTPKEVLILYEYDHTIRHVFIDGRKHPNGSDISLTYMGDSIGHWDGDTLVVDTVGFNEKTWLDRIGHPHSDQLHVIERFQRKNLNDLEVDITMEDPKALAKPWNAHIGFQLHPDWSLSEQVCTDNGDFTGFEK
jgi:hypothetical protein